MFTCTCTLWDSAELFSCETPAEFCGLKTKPDLQLPWGWVSHDWILIFVWRMHLNCCSQFLCSGCFGWTWHDKWPVGAMVPQHYMSPTNWDTNNTTSPHPTQQSVTNVPSVTLSVQISPGVHFSSLQFQQRDTEEKKYHPVTILWF